MELTELTRKAATEISGLNKKDQEQFEVDVDNYLRKIIDNYASERVKANSHYLLSKFVHTVANATKSDFNMFDKMMKEIGYTITRT